MSATHICPHSSLRLHMAKGQPFSDSNIIMMQVGFACEGCGKLFRAVGVRPGVSYDAPSTLDDGATTMMPIVPVGEEPDVDTRALVS